MYRCPTCGYTAEEDGECPMCNVPMVEAEEDHEAEGSEGDRGGELP